MLIATLTPDITTRAIALAHKRNEPSSLGADATLSLLFVPRGLVCPSPQDIVMEYSVFVIRDLIRDIVV
jgi:hypothetical protein